MEPGFEEQTELGCRECASWPVWLRLRLRIPGSEMDRAFHPPSAVRELGASALARPAMRRTARGGPR